MQYVTLRVGYPRHNMPCIGNTTSGTYGGWIADLLEYSAKEWDITLEWRHIRHESIHIMNGSIPDACTYDVAQQHVDVCADCLWETPTRRLMSGFTPTLTTSEFFLVVHTKEDTDALDDLARVFKPFSPELWVLILFCCIVVGVAMWYLGEVDPPEDSYGPVATALVMICMGFYLALMRFLGRGGFSTAKTQGGRFVVFGFGFLCLIGAASYTANMASFLLVGSLEFEVTSMADAISKGAKICVQDHVVAPLIGKFPGTKDLLVQVQDHRFMDLISNMDNGVCECAVVEDRFYHSMRAGGHPFTAPDCSKKRIAKSVISFPVGMPIDGSFSHVIGYLLATMTYNGKVAEFIAKYPEPASKCQEDVSIQGALGLKPHHLSGVLLLLGLCIIAGLLWHLALFYANRAKAAALARVEEKGEDLEKRGEAWVKHLEAEVIEVGMGPRGASAAEEENAAAEGVPGMMQNIDRDGQASEDNAAALKS